MRVLILLCIAATGCAMLASAASVAVSSGTVTSDEAGTCTATAARDTYVDELLSTLSFGTAADLHVRSQGAANQRTLVRFDLSLCSIPASATVVSASLRLVLTTAPGSSRTHVVHRITAAWTEATAWSTKPTVAGSVSASAATGTTAGTTISWPVTDDVSEWIAGTAANEGWQVADGTESDVAPVDTSYGAREHTTAASRPQLFVAWEP